MNRPRTGGGGGFGPGAPGMMGAPGVKAKDSRKTLQTLLRYLQPYRVKVIIVMIFAALSSIFSIVGPKLLGKVTTKLAEGLIAYYFRAGLYMDFAYMGRLIVLLISLYTISMIFSYIQAFIMSGVSMQVTYNLRKEIDQKISRLPLKFYDTTTHGEVLSRVTNDVDMISQSLNQSISQLITSVATVIGVLVMMFTWLAPSCLIAEVTCRRRLTTFSSICFTIPTSRKWTFRI